MPMTWALVTARIVRLEFPSDDVGRVIAPYRPERHLHAPTQLRTCLGRLDLVEQRIDRGPVVQLDIPLDIRGRESCRASMGHYKVFQRPGSSEFESRHDVR